MAWDRKTLEECTEYITDGDHQPAPKSDDGVLFIKIKDIKDSRVDFKEALHVPLVYYEGIQRNRKPVLGDTLYTVVGSYGLSAYVNFDIPFCFERNIALLHPKKGVDSRFLFYSVNTPDFFKQAENAANGAAQKLIPLSRLKQLKIQVPPFATQKKIADILSAYDNLIENNQKQIKLLEEAAQRLYKQWFIDLRYPGHETTPIVDGLPKGWRKEKFGDIVDYIRGTSYTSSELSDSDGVLMVNLKNINAFGGYKRNAEKRFTGKYKENGILEQGDLVMGCTDMTKERRLVGHVALIPNLREPTIFTMDLLKLLPKRISKTFLYAQCRFGGLSYKISPLANGANVLHLRPENMADIEVLCPAKSIVEMYDNVFASMISKIEKLEDEIQLAAESRNRLLPKLMNGELEV